MRFFGCGRAERIGLTELTEQLERGSDHPTQIATQDPLNVWESIEFFESVLRDEVEATTKVSDG